MPVYDQILQFFTPTSWLLQVCDNVIMNYSVCLIVHLAHIIKHFRFLILQRVVFDQRWQLVATSVC